MIRAPEREAAPLAEVSRPVTGQRRRALAQVVAPMIVFALVIGVWLFISYVLLEPRRRFLMPPPQEVVRIGFFDARNLSEILGARVIAREIATVLRSMRSAEHVASGSRVGGRRVDNCASAASP